MCRKLCFLISFVLVLCLALDSVSQGAVPGIIGHWKLDEGTGTVAIDSSGYGRDGTINGAPPWMTGSAYDNSGYLLFEGTDNDDWVDINYLEFLLPYYTVSLWFRLDGGVTDERWMFAAVDDAEGHGIGLAINRNNPGTLRYLHRYPFQEASLGIDDTFSPAGGPLYNDGQWHHVAAVRESDTSRLLYVDGQQVASNTNALGAFDEPARVLFGTVKPGWVARVWNGGIDDVRIYNRALTEDEIKLIMTTTEKGPQFASDPSPGDEVTDVCRDVVLSWAPGDYAPTTNGHRVFFSDDFNDVSDGVGGIVQSPNSYDPPGLLDWGTTYYWRVDEANSTIEWDEGEVWQFTTEPYAYILDVNSIDVNASSEYDTARIAENTINGSGLDANDDSHSTTSADMWLSAIEPIGASIEYEFDRAYKLYQMWVWNYNAEFNSEFGMKDVTITYSTNGVDYTTLGSCEFAIATGEPNYVHNPPIDMSNVIAKYVRLTATSNWGFSNLYGLSEVRFYYIPMRARVPSPDEETDVNPDVVLSWKAGREADEHQVYFGTDEQAVKEGTISPVSIPANGCETSYDPPGSLDLDQIYYWRIDEVNMAEDPNTWQGDTWNFTILEYLVVDDMESYNDVEPNKPDSNRINYIWEDGFGHGTAEYPPIVCGNGTGSLIGYESEPLAETTIVHGGGQSMPYYYINDGSGWNNCGDPINVYYSEAELTFDEPQNWDKAGIKALTLYFYGDPDNDISEPMWVKLTDQSDDSGTVTYGSYADEDVKNLAYPFWHEWSIALAEFTGVDLEHLEAISIGFGEPAATSQGGSGIVYFDDIRLYPASPVPSRLRPEADLTDDCVVDYDDIVILFERWLDSDLITEPLDPDNDNLVGHWKLDDGSGTTALDSSVNTNNGTLQGNTQWMTAGYDGGALLFDGDGYVELPIDLLIGSLTNSTFMAWTNFTDTGGSWQRIFDFGIQPAEGNPTVYMFLTPRLGADGPMRFAITTASAGGEELVDAPDTLPTGWHHVAVTIDADSNSITLYLDGLMVGQNTETTLSPSDLGETTNNWLGRSQWAVDANYAGLIDDFRIYSRALSVDEVAWLAGRTEAFSIPADLYEDGVIDLKDFADLGAAWLEERLWPEP